MWRYNEEENMKIIKVDNEIHEKLMRLKLGLKHKSINQTIYSLLKLVKIYKLRKELERVI